MDQFKATNFTQPSNLAAAIATGKTLLGVGVSFPSTETAKKVALTGYDWAFIDAEHAPFTPVLLADIIQTISFHSQGKMIPVIRVPSHEPSFIGVALDAGASGIVLPHTETREQAQNLVNLCRFPPEGKRSYPPWSWIPGINDQVPEGETIATMSNKHVVCIAQIESALGVENAEDIISLEGIDCVMIGIGDLQMDMGYKLDWNNSDPKYVAAIDKVEGLARKYNKPLVGFAFPEMKAVFEDRVRRGYQLFMSAADSYSMVYGLTAGGFQARQMIADVQATMKEEQEAKTKKANGVSNGQYVPEKEAKEASTTTVEA